MGSLANSEDLENMLQIVSFHKGQSFLAKKQSPVTELYHNLETLTCDPLQWIILIACSLY